MSRTGAWIPRSSYRRRRIAVRVRPGRRLEDSAEALFLAKSGRGKKNARHRNPGTEAGAARWARGPISIAGPRLSDRHGYPPRREVVATGGTCAKGHGSRRLFIRRPVSSWSRPRDEPSGSDQGTATAWSGALPACRHAPTRAPWRFPPLASRQGAFFVRAGLRDCRARIAPTASREGTGPPRWPGLYMAACRLRSRPPLR